MWRADLSGYAFANVAERSCKGSEALALPQCQPQYFHGTDEPYFQVTSQNGNGDDGARPLVEDVVAQDQHWAQASSLTRACDRRTITRDRRAAVGRA